jgi:hypothetical protein
MSLSKAPCVTLSEPVRVRHSNSELNWAYSFRGHASPTKRVAPRDFASTAPGSWSSPSPFLILGFDHPLLPERERGRGQAHQAGFGCLWGAPPRSIFSNRHIDYRVKGKSVRGFMPQPPALRLRSLVLEREAASSPLLLPRPLRPQHASHHMAHTIRCRVRSRELFARLGKIQPLGRYYHHRTLRWAGGA